ncbi:hypothetical protein F2Q69_00014961 [Brassica cretica]|uniref:Uncharacterized protein n=1 Tax=Brassica cretica TaxID=69181 RepID=A0A8S9R5T2_BRACR|nr:hypothetical protein F2Q69_00014961 [Brassica cretica]
MTATLGDEEGDSQSSPTEGRAGEEVNIRSKVRSPWTKPLPTESPGSSEVVDGVVSITIPDEILSDPDPLWRCYAVGYFIGDAPHVGTIHATKGVARHASFVSFGFSGFSILKQKLQSFVERCD